MRTKDIIETGLISLFAMLVGLVIVQHQHIRLLERRIESFVWPPVRVTPNPLLQTSFCSDEVQLKGGVVQ